jgi:hypothetical protein
VKTPYGNFICVVIKNDVIGDYGNFRVLALSALALIVAN